MTSAWRKAGSLVVAGLALALGANAAMAQTPGHGTGPDLPSASELVASGAARESHSVTLLTGDRVTITSVDGGGRMVTVDPGPERDGVGFVERETEGGGLHVIPADALELIAAGRLDARLFDVTELIEQGLDDRSSDRLPLIVRYEDGARTLRAKPEALTVAGARVERELPSIDGAAVRASKDATPRLWEHLADEDPGVQALSAGIAEVRLDGRVQASLDESVPMVGAPSVWDADYTGQGVRVAVLDTGIDANHPDVGDAVTAAEDFTFSDVGTADLFGHGTHVSSIAVGRGAASDGQYSGVAPDADLLVGKVLDDYGFGYDSWIIAGMEWAVDQRADVVNLSLGGCATDGSDPLAEAVNTLTEQAGTLFVVAAGNHPSSECLHPETVSSPASADHALAVGSVNKQGELSGFSNTGPRLGDGAVKPELTAPGESIVAARAEGTLEDVAVGDHYARLSGTSMASPHVAGVAALLAEMHPDWTADELRAALLGSAVPHPDLGAYQQGAGLVDAERAAGQQVLASPPSLSMGLASWPHDDDEPISTTLTYRNTGDELITLDLSVTAYAKDGTPAPDQMFVVAPERLAVPAGGTAEVTVTADTSMASPNGAYSGSISGATGDGDVVVTTPVGVVKEVESYDLTIDVIDRDGEPTWTIGYLGDLTAETLSEILLPGEPVTFRLPAGQYDLNGAIFTESADDPEDFSLTLAARPELVLDRDLAVSLDARDGQLVQATVDSTTAVPELRRAFLHTYLLLLGISTHHFEGELYATPTPQVTDYDYTFGYQSALAEPEPTRNALPRGYQLYLTEPGRIPGPPTFRVRDSELARLDTTVHSQGVADKSTAELLTFPMVVDEWVGWGQSYEVQVPGDRIDLYSEDATVRWASELITEESGEIDYYDLNFPEYHAGRRYDKDWNKAAIGPVARPVFAHGALWAGLSPFSSSGYRHVTFTPPDGVEMSTTLKKDGEIVGTSDDPSGGAYELPPPTGSATYELTTHATREVAGSTLATQVDATWTVTAGPVRDYDRLPLLAMRIGGDFDLLNRAPAHRPFQLDLTVERADGADPAVDRIALEISFDDGDTWEEIPLRPTRDGFSTQVPRPPAGSEFVSLRTSAEDTDGSQLDQTVIRAYQLAQP